MRYRLGRWVWYFEGWYLPTCTTLWFEVVQAWIDLKTGRIGYADGEIGVDEVVK